MKDTIENKQQLVIQLCNLAAYSFHRELRRQLGIFAHKANVTATALYLALKKYSDKKIETIINQAWAYTKLEMTDTNFLTHTIWINYPRYAWLPQNTIIKIIDNLESYIKNSTIYYTIWHALYENPQFKTHKLVKNMNIYIPCDYNTLLHTIVESLTSKDCDSRLQHTA